MNLSKMLADLRREHAQIEEVILNLERLAATRESRRGRPPSVLLVQRRRGRPPGSRNRPKAAILPSPSPAQAAHRPPRTMAAGQSAAEPAAITA